MKFKEFYLNHKRVLSSIGFFLILAFLICLIYREWIFHLGILAQGDWLYHSPQAMKTLRLNYFSVWLSDIDFGRVLFDVGQAPSYFLYGVLAKYLQLNYGLVERLVHFWPIIILNPLGSYLLAKKIFKNKLAALVSAIVYTFNSYFFTLHTGHITLATAFAFTPIIFYFYFKNLKSFKYQNLFITTVFLFIATAYEPRAAYLICLILGLYGVYNFFSDYTANKKKFFKYLLFVLGPLILNGLFNFYWIYALTAIGSLSDNSVFYPGLFGDQFWSLIYGFVMQHPWWGLEGIQVFVNQPVYLYYWLIPIAALTGLYLNRKNKIVVFFGLLAVLGLFLIKQSDPPLANLYLWMFHNIPGFNAFREASKFYILIVLSYSILIGSLVNWLYQNWQTVLYKRILKSLIITGIILIFLSNAWPIITGQSISLFKNREIPQIYIDYIDFINQQNEFFRIIWVPYGSTWSETNQLHPAISAAAISGWDNILENYDNQQIPNQVRIIEKFNQDFSNQLLDNSSIKYLAIPLKNDNNNPFYNYGNNRDFYITNIENINYLNQVWQEDGVIVFENEDFKPRVYLTLEPETIYKNISFEKVKYQYLKPTKFYFELNNLKGDSYLNFTEQYHPDWSIRPADMDWFDSLYEENYFLDNNYHEKSDANLNSFKLDQEYLKNNFPQAYSENSDGTYNLKGYLYFKSQANLILGLYISALFFLLSFIYFIYVLVKSKK